MKKNLVLFVSSMSLPLVAANTLQLVSCQKKNQKNDKSNQKSSEEVELEISTKLKNEIRNAIDDIVTNPSINSVDDWIIKLDNNNLNNKDDIKKLNEDVKEISGNNNIPKNLDQVGLSTELIDKVNEKYASLKEKIIDRIRQSDILEGSDFIFDFDEVPLPRLTSLSGEQVLQAVKKLVTKKKSALWTSYKINNIEKTSNKENDEKDSTEIESILSTPIDLFKVVTNLRYSFSFASKSKLYSDSYNDCELLLTGNTNNLRKVKKYTQEKVNELINKSDRIKKLYIYPGEDLDESLPILSEFDNIGKKFNWDFSQQPVKDEIKELQLKLLHDKSSDLKDIIDDLKYKPGKVNFEPFNWMQFTNKALSRKQNDKDALLYNGSNKLNSTGFIMNSIAKQFGIDVGENANESNIKKQNWDGGKINAKFVEKLKQNDSELKIDYSQYYGVGSEAVDQFSDFLVGYGTTTITNPIYAGMALATIKITTQLLFPEAGINLKILISGFLKYFEALLNALWNTEGQGDEKNRGIISEKRSASSYFIQWNFGYDEEWQLIQDKVDENGGTINFNWIMENILLKQRAKKSYGIDLDNLESPITKEAVTSLVAENDINYNRNKENNLVKDDFKPSNLVIYVMYGPFKIYLTDTDSKSIWSSNEKNPGFTNVSYYKWT